MTEGVASLECELSSNVPELNSGAFVHFILEAQRVCDQGDDDNQERSPDLGMNLLITVKGLLAPCDNLLLAEGWPGDLEVLKIAPQSHL